MDKHYQLIHNTAMSRYEFDLGNGARALIDYEATPQGYRLTHTEVPAAFEGQGIARQLVEATLEEFRRRGDRIIPECSYIALYIRRHPEWQPLVADGNHSAKPSEQ